MAQRLRDYQVEAFDSVREEIKKLLAEGLRGSVLLVLPCGGGKTTVVSHFIVSVDRKGNFSLFLVRKEELLDQADARLHEHDVPHGIIKAGRNLLMDKSCYVASTPTLVKRFKNANPQFAVWQPRADVIVIDEAHEAITPTTLKVLAQYPKAILIGITATPIRGDGKGLGVKSGGIFESMVKVSSKAEMIDEGYLTDYVLYEPPVSFDFSKVKIKGGEFDQVAAAAAVDKPDLIGDVYKTWKEKADGKRTLIFAQSCQHGKHILEDFLAKGVRAAYLDSDTPKELRPIIRRDFEANRYTVLINVNIYIQGVDFPFLECTVIARGTASIIFWIQMTGRGDRPMYARGMPQDTAEQRKAAIAAGLKPRCIVIDHAGNAKFRFGLPDVDHNWSLDSRKKRAKPTIPSFTKCPLPCGALLRSTTRSCPVCGATLIVVADRGALPSVADAVLVEAPRDRKARECREKVIALETERNYLSESVQKQVALGYNWKYAPTAFKKQFGSWPKRKHGIQIDWLNDGENYYISSWSFGGTRYGDPKILNRSTSLLNAGPVP